MKYIAIVLLLLGTPTFAGVLLSHPIGSDRQYELNDQRLDGTLDLMDVTHTELVEMFESENDTETKEFWAQQIIIQSHITGTIVEMDSQLPYLAPDDEAVTFLRNRKWSQARIKALRR